MTPRKQGGSATGYPGNRAIWWKLTAFLFFVVLFSALIIYLLYRLFLRLIRNTSETLQLAVRPIFLVGILLCACLLIAVALFGLLSKYYLRPLKRLIQATREIREGHFDIRVQDEGQDYRMMPEMQILIRNFNEMATELRGIELFRNDFINNFSHEFKTPIISIRGFARELRQEGLTDAQREEYARIIEEESDRLARLSSNVLTLSKLENQQIVTGQTEFYLDEQIRQSILLLESEWSGKEIEMIPELETLKYWGNEEMLALVWRNLLGNAIKFTPQGGQVRVAMKVTPATVTVTVSDNGIGMSDEVRTRIFEKFYQGDPSHAHAGYGIGLSLVGRAVQLMDGSIEVESEVGKGSSFAVTLPR